jgi:hypothetical protein
MQPVALGDDADEEVPGLVLQEIPVHAAARFEHGARVGEERVGTLVGVRVVDVDLVARRLESRQQVRRMHGALEVERHEAGHEEAVQRARRIRAGNVHDDRALAGAARDVPERVAAHAPRIREEERERAGLHVGEAVDPVLPWVLAGHEARPRHRRDRRDRRAHRRERAGGDEAAEVRHDARATRS